MKNYTFDFKNISCSLICKTERNPAKFVFGFILIYLPNPGGDNMDNK